MPERGGALVVKLRSAKEAGTVLSIWFTLQGQQEESRRTNRSNGVAAIYAPSSGGRWCRGD